MNIYITGLNYSINDADLNDLFAEYGEITSAKVIMDRETGNDPEDLVFLYPAFPYTGNILAFYFEFLQNRLIININKYR